MLPRSRLGLLQRLFALVGIALLPAVLLLVGAVTALRTQHAEAARDQARRIAGDATARLERLVEGIRQTLLVLSESDSVRAGDAAACGPRLHKLGQRLPEQVLIGAIDRDGWVLCTTAGTPPRVVNSGDRPFHRLALERGGFVVTGLEQSTLLRDGGSLHMAMPIPGEPGHPPAGTVAAGLGVGWIAGQLRSIGLPPGAELLVLDGADRVVVRVVAAGGEEGPEPGEPAPEPLRRLLSSLLVSAAAAGPEADAALGAAGAEALPPPSRTTVVSARDRNGAARLYAVAPVVAGTGGALRLVVSLDAEAAMAPVAEAGRLWALLVALGLGASLLAARVGARRFLLAPIAALQETARRWAAGEYTARATPALDAPPPEFARLASALDQVAAAAEQRDRTSAALVENEARLSLALAAGGLGAWEIDPRSGTVLRSPQHDALFGYARPQAEWSYRRMLRHVLPQDRAMVEATFRRALAEAAPLRAECRIRRAGDGEIRWLEATGAPHRGPDGRMKYLGVLADVTERRRAEERLRLVAGELNHRVKNTLAAVQSIAAQTLRWPAAAAAGEAAAAAQPVAPEAEAARAAFEARLLALARSHELLTREGWSGASLSEVVERALAAHAGGRQAAAAAATAAAMPAAGAMAAATEAPVTPDGTPPGRVRIAGPPVRLSPRSATPLAMALHELATNAVRHGALSVPEGRVEVSWKLLPPGAGESGEAAAGDGSDADGARLSLRWTESGGPPVPGPPARRGFGSRLLERGLAYELHGAVRLDFAPGGVVCEIVAPLSAVSPGQADVARGCAMAPEPTAMKEAEPPERAAVAGTPAATACPGA